MITDEWIPVPVTVYAHANTAPIQAVVVEPVTLSPTPAVVAAAPQPTPGELMSATYMTYMITDQYAIWCAVYSSAATLYKL
jgi:hypothetical protein